MQGGRVSFCKTANDSGATIECVSEAMKIIKALPASSFFFPLAKRDFARNFEYERDFYKAAPAITLLLHFDLFFQGMRFWNKKAYYKSDHISLALAQKTKATFQGGSKKSDQPDEDLDFEKFDFDAFQDFDYVDPDAGKSTASYTNPPPATSVPVLAVLPSVPIQAKVEPVPSTVPPAAVPVYNFYVGHH